MREKSDSLDASESTCPVIQRQATFGQTGELAVSDEPVETSLVDVGAAVDYQERLSRLDLPEAETFGRDDRPVVQRRRAAEQLPLFAAVDTDQRTLDGEMAAFRSLFDER